MKKVLAFDIGGTKIAYAIIDESGNFINEIIKVTTPKTSNGIYELLKTVIIFSSPSVLTKARTSAQRCRTSKSPHS